LPFQAIIDFKKKKMISTKSVLIVVVVASVAVHEAVAYEKYLSVIPGSSIETGHPGGNTGGNLTKLAVAFKKNRYKWSQNLCNTYGPPAGLKCGVLNKGKSKLKRTK
jgi:hypothetical protein